eukprot:comp8598_c0_seq1/m.3883 comp8598_c0_seq1/g.3883  ORF comp8598_c0_seq1/g.3883 comp8598_c0_seq1/m.3883 type:complete len:846 (-) comp8598_c0_seq1:717-3254(-)
MARRKCLNMATAVAALLRFTVHAQVTSQVKFHDPMMSQCDFENMKGNLAINIADIITEKRPPALDGDTLKTTPFADYIVGAAIKFPKTDFWEFGYKNAANVTFKMHATDYIFNSTQIDPNSTQVDGVKLTIGRLADFGMHGVGDPISMKPINAALDSIFHIPLFGEAMVISYHLPGYPAEEKLILNAPALLGIFSGQISNWAHPIFGMLNQGALQRGFVFPNETITTVSTLKPENALMLISMLIYNGDLAKAQAVAASVATGTFQTAVLPNQIVIPPTGELSDVTKVISDTKYSIGVTIMMINEKSVCNKNTRAAALINRAGVPVEPTDKSIQAAADAAVESNQFTDLYSLFAQPTNLPGNKTYPLMFFTTVSLDREWKTDIMTATQDRPRGIGLPSHSAEPCRRAYEMVRFLDWFSTSTEAQTMAKAFNIIMLRNTKMYCIIKRALMEIKCDGTRVYSALIPVQQKEIQVIAPLRIAFLAIATIFIFASLCLLGWVFLNQEKKIVRASSPVFLKLILIGSIISYAYVAAMYAYPSPAACVIQPILYHIGYIVMYGAITLKTFRVWRLFDPNWSLTVRKKGSNPLTDQRLGIYLAVMLILMSAYLAIWMGQPKQRPVPLMYPEGDTAPEIYKQCTYNAWDQGLLAVEIVFLLLAAFIAFKARGAPQAFNEAKWLGLAIYNWVLITVAGTLLSQFAFRNFPTPDARFAVMCVCQLLAIGSGIGFMFAPKLYALITDQSIETTTFRNTSQREQSIAKRKSEVSSIEEDKPKGRRNPTNLTNEGLLAGASVTQGDLQTCCTGCKECEDSKRKAAEADQKMDFMQKEITRLTALLQTMDVPTPGALEEV